jgi:hypothetical protein
MKSTGVGVFVFISAVPGGGGGMMMIQIYFSILHHLASAASSICGVLLSSGCFALQL